MIGNETFYKNTVRTIVGLINPVFDNDVVLLCDTSLGVVNLQLLEILADRFSTQYKLYVVDKSNNAGTNNITITAPIGFTVNNSSVAVINVNNGVAVITISSNTTYNAQFNYNVGGGGAIVVKNEGIVITTNATSFNYVGADVTATAIGGDVTVAIQPSFIIVTNAQIQTLITTNALVPNQDYLITNAVFTNVVISTVSIIVKAITTNEITISGSGIFLNADYQAVGDYSSVVGFAGQIGIFYVGIPCVIGNVVIWNNLQWVSLNGTSLLAPDIDPLSWSLLPKTSTNGYITEIDIIKYDVATNIITYREDIRGNRIENNVATLVPFECFYVFQWGNNFCYGNTIADESFASIINSMGTVRSNTIIETSKIEIINNAVGSSFENNQLNSNSILRIVGTNSGIINGNVLKNLSTFICLDNSSEFVGNVFNSCQYNVTTNQGTINFNQLTDCLVNISLVNLTNFSLNTWNTTSFVLLNDLAFAVSNTFVDSGVFNMTQINYQIDGGIIQNNVGTIKYGLDMSDPTIYNVGTRTLTIPLGLNQFIGEFTLYNGGGQIIQFIVNLGRKYATKFLNRDPNTFVDFLVNNSVAVAGVNELVSTSLIIPVSYRMFCSLTFFQDSIYIRNNNFNLNSIEQVYVYQ